jgi:hypothetical protein
VRWLATTDHPIARNAVARHKRDHLGVPSRPGPRPLSDDFLEAIRDRAHLRMAEGEIEPGIKDGIQAQAALDRRAAEAGRERDILLKLALVLTGQIDRPRVIDPEDEAARTELKLLNAGASRAEIDAAREAILPGSRSIFDDHPDVVPPTRMVASAYPAPARREVRKGRVDPTN